MSDPAPLFATDAAPIPAGAKAEWFEGAGGARLRAALIPAKGAARGTVVLSGGRTEPIEKYFEVIGELTGRGFTVVTHDWRGQGLSQRLLPERLKGHAVGFDDVLGDYRALIAAFESRMPKPWIMMSHSMGGCLTALALARGENRFAVAMLSAPMLGIFTPPFPPSLAKAMAQLACGVGLGGALVLGGKLDSPPAPFDGNALTHDPRRYARNVEQVIQYPDLALGPPTWGWLDFAFAAFHELHHGVGVTEVQTPVLVFAAGEDTVVDNRDLRVICDRFPKGEYIEVAGARHEILQETDPIRAIFWREFDALVGTLNGVAA